MRGIGGAGRASLPLAVEQSELARGDPFGAAAVAAGITDHVISTTKSSYSTAVRAYESYCTCYELTPWPTKEMVVAGWLHYMIVTVGVQSLGMYVAGLQYQQGLMGLPWTLGGSEVLRRTTRYLKRMFPVKQGVPKLPVSVQLIRAIFPLLRGWPVLGDMEEDDRVFAVATVIAVAGFLRGGEFLASPTRALLPYAGVKVVQHAGQWALEVEVPQPKAMFWLESQTVLCFATDDDFCPLRLWEAYVALAPRKFSAKSAAFRTANGRPLARAFMVGRTADLVGQLGVSFQDAKGAKMAIKASSWRAGAVRSALDAGVPEPYIMAMGRWKSQAWINYVVDRGLDLRQTAHAMWAPSQSRPPTKSGAVVEMFVPASALTRKDDDECAARFSKLHLN
jgi:hypothetical protein